MGPGELARSAGLSASRVSDLESDRYRMPDAPTLLKIAKVLRCSVDDLLEGVDPEYQAMLQQRQSASNDAEPIDEDVRHFRPEDIPLIQEGDASPEGLVWDSGDPIAADAPRTSRPYDFRENGAYAVVLRGDSMEPLLKRGMRLIVSPTQKVGDGDLVYAQLRDGERLIKLATRQNGGWLLMSANPAHVPRYVRGDDVEHIHKVAYVRFLK